MLTQRSVLAALGLLLIGPCLAEVTFFEEFGSGWDSRWIYSSDEKYSGRFEVEAPEGSENPALKVRRLISAGLRRVSFAGSEAGTPRAS